MHGRSLAKDFGQLSPRERLTLLLQAQARGDKAEEQRLFDTIPMKSYKMWDSAFSDAYDAIRLVCYAAGMDFRFTLGRMSMLSRFERMTPVMLVAAAGEASNAAFERPYNEMFDEGDTENEVGEDDTVAQGEANDEADGGGKDDSEATEDDEPIEPADLGEDNTVSTDASPPRNASDFEARARALCPEAEAMCVRCQGDMVAEEIEALHALFYAFDQFCRKAVGLDGWTVMRAWIGGLVPRMESYGVGKPMPDSPLAKEYERLLTKQWHVMTRVEKPDP